MTLMPARQQMPKAGKAAPGLSAAGMRRIPGGDVRRGSDRHSPEERPAHRASVAGFLVDAARVTTARFTAFVAATASVTVAERPLDPAHYPGALVSRPPGGPVALRDHGTWWAWTPGACWRCPEGPGSSLRGREDHPVVHVALEDAEPVCCAATKARDPAPEGSCDPARPAIRIPRAVVKGGSFLYAPSCCRRDRPAARHAQRMDTGMSHIGCRCVRRDAAPPQSDQCKGGT